MRSGTMTAAAATDPLAGAAVRQRAVTGFAGRVRIIGK
jgi:hypothetical protein